MDYNGASFFVNGLSLQMHFLGSVVTFLYLKLVVIYQNVNLQLSESLGSNHVIQVILSNYRSLQAKNKAQSVNIWNFNLDWLFHD